MPYKSDSQRRKFHAMEARGEISNKVVKEFDEASNGMKLPEAIRKKKGKEAQRKAWRGGSV
jgi:hypothetical protein